MFLKTPFEPLFLLVFNRVHITPPLFATVLKNPKSWNWGENFAGPGNMEWTKKKFHFQICLNNFDMTVL